MQQQRASLHALRVSWASKRESKVWAEPMQFEHPASLQPLAHPTLPGAGAPSHPFDKAHVQARAGTRSPGGRDGAQPKGKGQQGAVQAAVW